MPSNPNGALPTNSYVGRFAPSPTGPLHFGSLVAAVASYLDAKANSGLWLMRMEDLDPPREPAGMAELILDQLIQLGLEWDGEVLYQSSRLDAYQTILNKLNMENLCFACECTRQQIRDMGSVYNGNCRERTDISSKPVEGVAIRLCTDNRDIAFEDQIQGHFRHRIESETGDFVIRRKDSLFAYQLAVVADDEHQGITHIIRGFDLLDSTARQIYLQQLLNFATPVYGHIPIVVNDLGQKLSKQHFAESIDVSAASHLIYESLRFLGQSPPNVIKAMPAKDLLNWGIDKWDIQAVPKLATIPLDIQE